MSFEGASVCVGVNLRLNGCLWGGVLKILKGIYFSLFPFYLHFIVTT